MKRTLAGGALCFFLAGCGQQGQNSGQSAQTDIDTLADQQKEQVEAAAKEAQRQVKEAAEAQERRIEAEAKAAKAAIEAQKARAEAALKTQQWDAEEQSSRIRDAVGSAQQAISGKRQSDAKLLEQARQQAQAAEGVQVTVENGVVTLLGTVNSEQEKTQIEDRIKNLEGVQDVKSGLEVQAKK